MVSMQGEEGITDPSIHEAGCDGEGERGAGRKQRSQPAKEGPEVYSGNLDPRGK